MSGLTEWRAGRELGERYVLKYGQGAGLELRLRRVSMLGLAERGRIPTPLFGVVNDWMGEETVTMTVETYPKYAEVVDLIVGASVVEPAIADAPGEDGPAPDVLYLSELDALEKLAIFNWALGAGAEVLPFPKEPNGNGGAVRDGVGVRDDAVETARA